MTPGVLLIVVLGRIANDCNSLGGSGKAYRNADPRAAAAFNIIVCDTDVAASQTDTHYVQACGASGVANVGVDFAFICGGKVSDTTTGNARIRRYYTIMVYCIVVTSELTPNG